MNYRGRIQRLQAALTEQDADGLLVTNLTNVRYLTGFSGTNGQVLVTADDVWFFTDGRYEARAAELVKDASIEIYYTRLADVLGPRIAAMTITRVGVEAKTMTLGERDDLADRLDGVKLIPTSNLVEELRRTKEAEEIDRIREAIAVADSAHSWVLDRLAPGQSEARIALDLEVYMRTNGAEAISFEPIVGSGPLSAHIHHTPGERILEKGDIVLLDFGAKVDGYCSDLTRTVVLGTATDDQQGIYTIVLAAQRAAQEAMRAGASCRDVDAAARSVITDAGHGDHFGHGLGHGVGLDIHEQPRMARVSEQTLRANEVVTDEPGIYVVGSGGIRIEDCMLVTEEGAESLTGAPKDTLLEL